MKKNCKIIPANVLIELGRLIPEGIISTVYGGDKDKKGHQCAINNAETLIRAIMDEYNKILTLYREELSDKWLGRLVIDAENLKPLGDLLTCDSLKNASPTELIYKIKDTYFKVIVNNVFVHRDEE